MTDKYKVYAFPDERRNVINCDSDAFLKDTTGWIQIDEGAAWDDKYHHPRGNYFNQPITVVPGVYRYRLADDGWSEKTDAEISAEVAALPPPQPTDEDRIAALETLVLQLGGVI